MTNLKNNLSGNIKKFFLNKKNRFLLQVVYGVLVLILFFLLGLPFRFLIILSIFFLFTLTLKGKIYIKINSFVNRKFPFMKKFSSPVQKIIIFLSFIVFFFLIKQGGYFILKLAGLDVQGAMSSTVNQSRITGFLFKKPNLFG